MRETPAIAFEAANIVAASRLATLANVIIPLEDEASLARAKSFIETELGRSRQMNCSFLANS